MSEKDEDKTMNQEEAEVSKGKEEADDTEEAVEKEAQEEEVRTEEDAAASNGEEGEKREKDGRKKQPSKLEELNDKMMRTLAEFENFRKRSEKEKAQMFEIGAKSVIEKILPVMDNFERGLASIPEEEKAGPFAEGIQMVYKQMLAVFDEIGVKAIEAVGNEFDPNLHNAVMTVEDDGLDSNTVCEELQKGYLYKDSVVRHSMVKVVS